MINLVLSEAWHAHIWKTFDFKPKNEFLLTRYSESDKSDFGVTLLGLPSHPHQCFGAKQALEKEDFVF